MNQLGFTFGSHLVALTLELCASHWKMFFAPGSCLIQWNLSSVARNWFSFIPMAKGEIVRVTAACITSCATCLHLST